jgi:hypothetical protein
LFDADGLAGEDVAKIDFLPVEADAAAGRDGDSLAPKVEEPAPSLDMDDAITY